MKTVRWTKPNDKPSAVHAVRSGSKEDGYTLECGAEIPISEREDVELNPQDTPTCGNCLRAVAGDGDEEDAS